MYYKFLIKVCDVHEVETVIQPLLDDQWVIEKIVALHVSTGSTCNTHGKSVYYLKK